MDIKRWLPGYVDNNELKFEVERLRRDNTELKSRVANLQLFYDEQSDQMTDLKKELVSYKTSMRTSMYEENDTINKLEHRLIESLDANKKYLARIAELEYDTSPKKKAKK